MDSTSARLLRRLGDHDPEAWRQFVRVYGAVVRFWIRQAGLNSADLADVFQDFFVAVSRNIVSFQRQSGQATRLKKSPQKWASHPTPSAKPNPAS